MPFADEYWPDRLKRRARCMIFLASYCFICEKIYMGTRMPRARFKGLCFFA